MKKTIALILTIAMIAVLFVGCGKGEPISWGGLFLGEHLPEIADAKGDVHSNGDNSLWFSVYDITETQYSEYIVTCKNFGYTVEATHLGSSFKAFNEDGYKLDLYYMESQKELSISLDAPEEMSQITWPASEVAQSIPVPKSTTGKISYDQEDFFSVRIGQMSKENYAQYVDECMEAGFTVDYDKQDTYFNAKNEDGISLTVRYEGANVISIQVEAKEEAEPEETEPEETEPEETEPEETQAATEAKSDELRADFKEAMDAYEEFMDDYVDFMKKYQKNPNDLTLLTKYAQMLSDYAEWAEKFEKWDSEDLNEAELAYYLKVQERVTKKLLEVAQ